MAVRIQIRRDIAANWVTANPVLFQGEIGYELDTRKMKIGDGATDWNSLAYNFTDSTGIDLLQVIEGNGAYYFKSTASDLGAGRYEMTKDIPAGGGFGISNSGVADGDILAEFASVDGFPNVTYLPSGPLTFYMNAVQTGGTKLTKLYAEFYTRTIAGVNTLIATSDFTDGLTGVATLFSSFVNMPVTRNIGLTDRLLIVIKANVTGAGTDPDITINIQGATSSRCRFPFESVTSVNGFFGDVTITKSDIGLSNVDNTSDINKPISTATQVALDTKVGLNSFGGINLNMLVEPDNNGFIQLNNYNLSIDPLQDSPNESENIFSTYVEYDPNSTGFALGRNGNAVRFFNSFFNHVGTGDLGEVGFINNNFTLGNGTDPIDVKGFSYALGFGTVAANCNIDGAMHGYGYQPSFDIGASLDTTNSYTHAFFDAANLSNVTSGYYTSFNSSPSIGSIDNNRNFTGFNLNPTIPVFTGNASFIGLGLYGTLGTFGTGGYYNGININPTITSVDSATGLTINMSGVTSPDVKAMNITGDVFINGDLTFTGGLSIGKLDAFFATSVVDGGGNPQTIHGLVTSVTAPNGVTTANADTIGVNTTMLVNLEDNSITTSGPFKLGLAATGLPLVVVTGTGSSLDYLNMALYALNLDGSSTGGTIDRVNGARVEAIPNGITTVNEFVAFEFNQLFGQVGTTVWGLHIVPTYAENFLGGSLKIGGADTVTNSSVALEIESETRAILLSRMTTAQRNSLTAINGMQVYNTTTDKFQGYAAGAWIDLH